MPTFVVVPRTVYPSYIESDFMPFCSLIGFALFANSRTIRSWITVKSPFQRIELEKAFMTSDIRKIRLTSHFVAVHFDTG